MSKKEITNYIDQLNSISDAFNLELETEMIQIRFMSEVERLMVEKSISKTKLALLIGTSPSFITQLFQGNKKLNLETIAKFQNALDYKFRIDAVKDVSRPLSYLENGNYEDEFALDGYKKMRVLKPSNKAQDSQQNAA